jgi:hypothetical protein
MVLGMDMERGRVTLSTKKLEATEGDMLRDPQVRCVIPSAVLCNVVCCKREGVLVCSFWWRGVGEKGRLHGPRRLAASERLCI